MRRGALVLWGALALAACEPEPIDPVPLPEAGPRRDAGPQPDANVARPLAPPTVDGVLDERAWRMATTVTSAVGSDRPGRALRRLSGLILRERLYVAVEGSLAAGDRLVVYVDAALGTTGGIEDLSTLPTGEGALDPAFARELELVEGARPDVAWGTAAMPHVATGLDDVAGWRELRVGGLQWIAAETAPVACSESACEASISLARLGGTRPRTIGIFARIVAADGTVSNQTLPADDAAQPQIVSTLLELEDGTTTIPDGGVDAGPPPDAGPPEPVIVDGIVDTREWMGALVAENTVTAAGTPFAFNALNTLRVLRTRTRLYVAVQGAISMSNAILMYVDHDVGGPDGLVMSTAVIADPTGALDIALSKEIYVPAEFRVDFAWGTVTMGATAGPSDARMGWRDVASVPTSLRAIPTDRAPTVCSGSACETSIALADLGVSATATVGIFVRLGSASFDALSNQTLPFDLPGAPELVNVVLQVPPP